MQIQLPKGKFKCIVADPPWPYDTTVKGAHAMPSNLIKDGSRRMVSVSDFTYPTMSMADIISMPVQDVAESDAGIFLWTTNSFMRQAYDVMDAWGFNPKTIITWAKTQHADPTKASMKQGWWFRGATEHAIFGVRGKLKRQSTKAFPTALLLPRIYQHSRKPDAFFAMVEVVLPGPRLELFARRTRPGWTAWGNQINQDTRAGLCGVPRYSTQPKKHVGWV